jgi:hypothetical protein
MFVSDGSGPHDSCCCGVTLGVHGSDGDGASYVCAKTEDWTPEGKRHGRARYLCDDSGKTPLLGKCNNPPVRDNITDQSVHLTWQVQKIATNRTCDLHERCVYQSSRPKKPRRSRPCPSAHDPMRVRVDGTGTNVNFGRGLKVTPLVWVDKPCMRNLDYHYDLQ